MNNTAKLVAAGEITRPVTVDCDGETLELKSALNGIIERLGAQQRAG